MSRQCVFCEKGPPEVTMSKEHVLRAWFAKHFPNNSKMSLYQTYPDPITRASITRQLEIPQSSFDMVVTEVCKSCNENWLNKKVEEPVGEIIVSLAYAKKMVIDTAACSALALWASKTAAVRALMDSGNRMIPSEHYHHIKNTLSPPPLTNIWIAHCQSAEPAWTRHLRFSERLEGQSVMTAHTTTIILGEVLFHIIGFSSPPENLNIANLDRFLQDISGNGVHRLWPDPSTLNWPLQSKISADMAFQISHAVFQTLQVYP